MRGPPLLSRAEADFVSLDKREKVG
jgi:hypothetical protein